MMSDKLRLAKIVRDGAALIDRGTDKAIVFLAHAYKPAHNELEVYATIDGADKWGCLTPVLIWPKSWEVLVCGFRLRLRHARRVNKTVLCLFCPLDDEGAISFFDSRFTV